MAQLKRSWQNWWQLYVLALLMLGLLILTHYLVASTGWRTFLDSGVIIIGYGLITVWLETHSTVLLRQPPTDFTIQIVESPEAERSSLMSSSIEFYIGSGSTLIYDMPEFPSDNPGSNGHHPARTIPSFPKDISNN